jgi:hypothetical protein
MSATPCEKNSALKATIDQVAEAIRESAHTLGDHGLSENDFYNGGIFRGAIERIRGQFSATMAEKRQFVAAILNRMQDDGRISDWESAGEANRHDYVVHFADGWKTAIELKGCLDGNNTTIYERPASANEFVLWSVCSNESSDPQHNVWSGIHTRLSAEIVQSGQLVDGLIVWDWVCGTISRPCPKLAAGHSRTTVGQFELPPPCIYLFPATVPHVRQNSDPSPHDLKDVRFLAALHEAFGDGADDFIHKVNIKAEYEASNTVRTTTIRRGGVVVKTSRATAIRRS